MLVAACMQKIVLDTDNVGVALLLVTARRADSTEALMQGWTRLRLGRIRSHHFSRTPSRQLIAQFEAKTKS